MSEAQWALLGVGVVVVILSFLFRGRLKAGLEVLGIKANVEASNHPPTGSPEAATSSPPPHLQSGDTITASGLRSFAASDAQDSVVNTGSNNIVTKTGTPSKKKR